MKIDRELLERYLDNALSTAQIAEVELALRGDAEAAALLKRLRQERALRVAALKSYEPAAQDIRDLAAAMMEDFRNEPLAKVERPHWGRRIAKAAAVLLIACGSFVAGQLSKSGATPAAQQWQVIVQQSNGETSTKEFTSLDEAQNYAAQVAGATARVDEGGVL